MKKFAILIALIAWFAVIAQFVLMMQNRLTDVGETIVRFFSFFTILTNTLVAIYFTRISTVSKNSTPGFFSGAGKLTAITVYIFIVGLVYQFLLRQVWSPTGLQKIVDELLHSVIPLLVLLYWFMSAEKKQLQYRQIFSWLLYPLFYLFYILIRGNFSGFYPYPFVDVNKLGISQVLINSVALLAVFILISAIMVFAGKMLGKKEGDN